MTSALALAQPKSPVASGPNPIASGSTLTTLRHALVIARRSLIKLTRTPEQLIDVTLQPVIFLALFTYIFGGAIAGGSQHQYLQFLVPGLLGQSIAMAGVALGQNLNADIEKGVFDRFRSLPIARSAPLVEAMLTDVVRYVIVCVMFAVFGSIMASGSRRTGSQPSPRSDCRSRLRCVSAGYRCSSAWLPVPRAACRASCFCWCCR